MKKLFQDFIALCSALVFVFLSVVFSLAILVFPIAFYGLILLSPWLVWHFISKFW